MMAYHLLKFFRIGRFETAKKNIPQIRFLSAAIQIQKKFKDALASIPPTECSTLENNLRVASEDTGSKTTTVGLWMDSGSYYEIASNNGVAHFMEHMVFKGTTSRTQTDLELEIESMGARFRAFTSREQSGIYAKCLTKDVAKVVDILGDIMKNLKLDEEIITKERKVILKELQDIEDHNSEEVVLDYLHMTAYQGTPLAYSIYGPTENINCISRTDIRNYMNDNIRPSRVVLAAAGGVKHEHLVSMAKNALGDFKAQDCEPTQSSEAPCRFTGSELRLRDDALPLTHIAIAVETAGWCSLDHIPLMVATAMIGSWDKSQGGGKNHSSILARASEVDNFSHAYRAINIRYKHTGLWGLYCSCPRMSCEDMILLALDEWMRLCTMVTDIEIERAKNALKTHLLLKLSGTTDVCKDIGRQLLSYSRRIPLHELEERIDAVTTANVRDVCSKYIYDKCPAIAAVGPTENLPDYTRIRAAMYWVRF